MSDWDEVDEQGLLVPRSVKQSMATPIERQLMDSVQHLENEFNALKRTTLQTSDLMVFDTKLRTYVTDTVNAAARLLEEKINSELDRMAVALKEVLAQELCEVLDEMMTDE